MANGAGDGGRVFWPLRIGPHRAKYYLMTGDGIDVKTAQQIGPVQTNDDDQLTDEALGIAVRLAAGSA
jgi:enoyl-CoA hydratase